jgi:hypothetical protein
MTGWLLGVDTRTRLPHDRRLGTGLRHECFRSSPVLGSLRTNLSLRCNRATHLRSSLVDAHRRPGTALARPRGNIALRARCCRG